MAIPLPEADALVQRYRRFEHALKRAGFVNPNDRRASANWGEFAKALGEDFFVEVRDSGEAPTLIAEPPRILMRETMTFEPPEPEPITDVVDLFRRGICMVRNNHLHGEKFINEPGLGRDAALVREALAVLERASGRHPAVAALMAASEDESS